MSHKLTEAEIIAKIHDGVGCKKFKKLFTKILKLHGIPRVRHLKSPTWDSEESSCMAGTVFTNRSLGFEHVLDEISGKETFRSIFNDCDAEVAEKLFFIAANFYRD